MECSTKSENVLQENENVSQESKRKIQETTNEPETEMKWDQSIQDTPQVGENLLVVPDMGYYHAPNILGNMFVIFS